MLIEFEISPIPPTLGDGAKRESPVNNLSESKLCLIGLRLSLFCFGNLVGDGLSIRIELT